MVRRSVRTGYGKYYSRKLPRANVLGRPPRPPVALVVLSRTRHIHFRGHTRISVQVDVRNTGNRPGEEVVQLYINDISASVTRPVKELKGFRRIALEPGETGTVQFELPVETLGFYDQDMRFTVEPGAFKVMVGRSSRDIVLEGVFEILAELA